MPVQEIVADIDGKQYRVRMDVPAGATQDAIQSAVGEWFKTQGQSKGISPGNGAPGMPKPPLDPGVKPPPLSAGTRFASGLASSMDPRGLLHPSQWPRPHLNRDGLTPGQREAARSPQEKAAELERRGGVAGLMGETTGNAVNMGLAAEGGLGGMESSGAVAATAKGALKSGGRAAARGAPELIRGINPLEHPLAAIPDVYDYVKKVGKSAKQGGKEALSSHRFRNMLDQMGPDYPPPPEEYDPYAPPSQPERGIPEPYKATKLKNVKPFGGKYDPYKDLGGSSGPKPRAGTSYLQRAREGAAKVEAESKVETPASGGKGAKTETGSSEHYEPAEEINRQRKSFFSMLDNKKLDKNAVRAGIKKLYNGRGYSDLTYAERDKLQGYIDTNGKLPDKPL